MRQGKEDGTAGVVANVTASVATSSRIQADHPLRLDTSLLTKQHNTHSSMQALAVAARLPRRLCNALRQGGVAGKALFSNERHLLQTVLR